MQLSTSVTESGSDRSCDEETEEQSDEDSGSDDAEMQKSGGQGIAVIDLTHEWGGVSSSDDFSSELEQPQQPRYRNVAQAVHAAEEAINQKSTPGFASNRIQAAAGLLIFLAVNLRILSDSNSLLIYVDLGITGSCQYGREGMYRDWWFILFVLQDALFVCFEIACVRRDRTLSQLEHGFQRKGNILKLIILYIYEYLILGVFSGWQILRSWRQLRNPGYRDSFLVELSDPSLASSHSMKMPLYSSHLTFLMETPFVLRTFHVFTKQYVDTCNISLLVSTFLSYVLVVYACVTFDYSISNFIRSQYAKREIRFGLAHSSYRGAELMAKAFIASSLWVRFLDDKLFWVKWALVAALFTDVLLIFIMLCFLSKKLSARSLFLCLPLWSADIGLLVDNPQLKSSAWLLTCMLDVIRCLEVAAALAVYAVLWQPLRTGESQGNLFYADRVAASFVLLLGCSAFQVLLRCSGIIGRQQHDEEESESDAETLAKYAHPQRGKTIFGVTVQESVHFVGQGGISEHLFSKGIGDQFASLMEIFRERQELKLSRLEVQRKLGAGGFGMVFEVRDTGSGRHYALKLQRRSSVSAAAVREAKALHAVKHDFVVRLIHVFCTADFYSILLELCEKDLNKCILGHLSPSGLALGLPELQVKRYTACMMLALEHLHSRNIIFRDVKPENTLTVRSSDITEVRYAKLADFGLATSVTAASTELDERNAFKTSSRLASSSSFVCQMSSIKVAGTPAFMPPDAFWACRSGSDAEQSMKLLFSRDWYALGCCLMLMLLGERGARKARNPSGDNQVILLPPDCEDGRLQEVLEQAKLDPSNDAAALDLALSLTSIETLQRAGPDVMRRSPFLKQAVLELEHLVSRRAKSKCRGLGEHVAAFEEATLVQ